ncbi:MAG: regulatory protein RecX [Chlamydiales bacterium]
MNITIEPKAGRQSILSIFLNGREWKTVHSAIFGRHPSFPFYSTEREWEQAFCSMEYQKVKNYVLKRLSAQHYHSQQLRKLLIERLVDAATIDRVIGECQTKGFLNDEQWLESFICAHRKRLGWPVILKKLHSKGLSIEEIRVIQNRSRNPEEERQTIQQLLETRYRSKNLAQFHDRRKVIASLMRKGFSYESILAALEK